MFLDMVLMIVMFIIFYFIIVNVKKNLAYTKFFGCMGILAAMHINRMITSKPKERKKSKVLILFFVGYGIYEMEISTFMMLAVVKISYSAWEITDRRDYLSKAKSKDVDVPKGILPRNPTLLEFMAYTIGFVSAGGPVAKLNDFMEFVNQEGNYAYFRPCPTSEFTQFFSFLMIVVIYAISGMYAPEDTVILDPSFRDLHLLRKAWLLNLFCIKFRFKYFVAFQLSQLGLNSAGISYNHETRKYDYYIGTHIWRFELCKRSFERTKVSF